MKKRFLVNVPQTMKLPPPSEGYPPYSPPNFAPNEVNLKGDKKIMTDFSGFQLELRQQITAIAQRFGLFECMECASEIQHFLKRLKIPGQLICLSLIGPLFCNIYHDRLQVTISTNGRHEAIAVSIEGQALIFDNIHPEGISRSEWLGNLYVPIYDRGLDGKLQIEIRNF